MCEHNDTPVTEEAGICAVSDTPCAEPIPEEPAAQEREPVEEAAAEPTEKEPEAEPAAQPVYTRSPAPVQPSKPRKQRRKPHILLRILLQLLSFVLSLVLFGTVIVGAVLLDLQYMTSAGGLKRLINAIIAPSHSVTAVVQPETEVVPEGPKEKAGPMLLITGDTTDPTADTVIGDINMDEIPEDILTGGGTEENVGSLVDWLCDQLIPEDSKSEINKEQVQSFMEKSTVSEFVAKKLTEYADDFINGTENASITAEEIMDLLEKNEEVMKSELNIELTAEQKDQIRQSVQEMVEESDLNTTFREKVNSAASEVLEQSTESLGGLEVEDIQRILRILASGLPTVSVIGAAVVLMLLLCALNYYNVPAGLTWSAIPCILAGLLLSAPIILVKNVVNTMDASSEIVSGVGNILVSFVDVFAPIHYGVLILGAALLVISIVWRIIRAAVRSKQAAAV